MPTSSRRPRILTRIALIAMIGLIAVALLSSSLLAGVVGLVTVVAVLVDMYLCARPRAAPERIIVDLRRRS